MNNQLQVFNFGNTPVRTIVKDGEPWWVLRDVCKALGYANTSLLANKLDEGERTKLKLNNYTEVIIVSKSGLRGILVGSNKPQVKPFSKWIANEVIPAMRRQSTCVPTAEQTYSQGSECEVQHEQPERKVEMQNQLQVINEQTVLGKDFKIYGDFENPLFLAKDVAGWIEHNDMSRMVNLVDDNEKLKRTLYVSGQNRDMWFLTEDGLYEVLMQSRKPIAKAFKTEVKKILKSVRKHGAYMTTEMLEKALLNPDAMIRVYTALKEEQEKRAEAEAVIVSQNEQITYLQPKADYYDDLVDYNVLLNFRETANELRMKERTFISVLIDAKYIYRTPKGGILPYANKKSDLFEVKEFVNKRNGTRGSQTLITPKGRDVFRELCKNLHIA